MKKLGIVLTVALALAAMLWLAATPANAQGPANLDDEVNRIARTLYCPVCPNTPLDVCNTQACVQWRALIKEKLQQGQTEQQIRDYFRQQYGDVVLGAPPAEGFNWLAYVLIPLFIVLGAVIVWVTARQWLVRQPATDSAAPETLPIPKEYADRIEKDLKEY